MSEDETQLRKWNVVESLVHEDAGNLGCTLTHLPSSTGASGVVEEGDADTRRSPLGTYGVGQIRLKVADE